MFTMTPKDIVIYLDKYIIGQNKAKKVIAIALRNRWRRMKINKSLRNEIASKNILMIGPTGVGKTEIAKRLSKLTNSPFIKVEATKFTEIGYIGKEVDSIIKDLIDITFKSMKNKCIKKNNLKIKKIVEEKILNALVNSYKNLIYEDKNNNLNNYYNIKNKLNDGLLENEEIDINLISQNSQLLGVEIISSPEMEDLSNQLKSVLKNIYKNKQKSFKISVKEARKILLEEELNRNLNLEKIKKKSIELIEQNGIVFIDEIDKICRKNNELCGIDVSREGVQRDLLPLIDGCTVSTKYGLIKTNNILFIASGSFSNSTPSDLIPELQGRLPIKVELEPLTIENFEKILTETTTSISSQYIALIATEGIELKFTNCGIKCIAKIAWKMNEIYENIGARRLYDVLEKLMEDISFNVSNTNNIEEILIDEKYVDKHLYDNNIYNYNLNKFIL